MTVIYIDILLSLNLFVDYLLLCATARLLHRPTRRLRTVLAALIGAASSLIILAPPLSSLLSFLYQAVTAALMVVVGFSFSDGKSFCKITVTLWIISALFSGIMTLSFTLLHPVGLLVQSGVIYYDFSPLLLVLLTCASYGVLCIFDRLTRKRVAFNCAYRVDIWDGNRHVMLRALLDSGHSLKDVFSGSPVILVNESALPSQSNPRRKTRYIPFASIGGDGMLLAFCPDRVTLYADNRHTDISGVWVAPVTSLGRGEYDALIGPAVSDMLFCPAHV